MTSIKDDLDYETLKDILTYDPITGFLERINAKAKCLQGRNRKPDAKHGYKIITINRRKYHEHRLAWILYYKEKPKGIIDHIDGNKTNNSINNLRVVTNRENQQNMCCHRKGNLPGCIFIEKSNRWRARIYINGKSKHLGYYATEEEAYNAYYKEALIQINKEIP